MHQKLIYLQTPMHKLSSHIHSFSTTQDCRKNLSSLNHTLYMVLTLLANENDHTRPITFILQSLHYCNLDARLSRFAGSIRP